MRALLRVFRRVAVGIRHLPGLRDLDPVWDRLRGPYLRVLDQGGRGVEFDVGGAIVRVPVEFARVNWDMMEAVPMGRFVGWIRDHQESTILDVGCADGIFSLAALAASPSVDVVAIDSHLPTLVAAERMTRFADRSRLRFVHGLIADRSTVHEDVDVASARTRRAMGTAGPPQIRYVNLGDEAATGVPLRTLAELATAMPRHLPVLLKMDVEGAELAALQGARTLLDDFDTTILLSVHPDFLMRYGHTVGDVAELLATAGYSFTVLSVDHEAHWWCERR